MFAGIVMAFVGMVAVVAFAATLVSLNRLKNSREGNLRTFND